MEILRSLSGIKKVLKKILTFSAIALWSNMPQNFEYFP
jgi:hypothetical protein